MVYTDFGFPVEPFMQVGPQQGRLYDGAISEAITLSNGGTGSVSISPPSRVNLTYVTYIMNWISGSGTMSTPDFTVVLKKNDQEIARHTIGRQVTADISTNNTYVKEVISQAFELRAGEDLQLSCTANVAGTTTGINIFLTLTALGQYA